LSGPAAAWLFGSLKHGLIRRVYVLIGKNATVHGNLSNCASEERIKAERSYPKWRAGGSPYDFELPKVHRVAFS
jgi:hypothetical protein